MSITTGLRMYRWTGSKPHSLPGDEEIAPGETFEPTESQKRAFPNRMEKVEGEPAPIDPGEHSVRDLREFIQDSSPDAETRAALAREERDGKNRSSAVDLLEP